MDRRGFLKGLSGILAAGVAPAIITTPGLLMPARAPVKVTYRGVELVYDDLTKSRDYFVMRPYEQDDLFATRSRALTVAEFTAVSAAILDRHMRESGTQNPSRGLGRLLNA